MLVDSHCHLDFPEFASDIDAVIDHAARQGVGMMQTICTRLSAFPEVLAMAERFPHVYCSVGVHPHHVEPEGPITEEALLAYTHHPKVIGIGETGLDFFYERSPRDLQEAAFRSHIAVARQTGLPLIVHTREARKDTIDLLKAHQAEQGVLHCFTEDWDTAKAALDLGFYISFSGIVSFANAKELREVAAKVPLDRILIETDSPYLAPVPYRGKKNEPRYLPAVAKAVAEVRGLHLEEVAQITSENFGRLFGINI